MQHRVSAHMSIEQRRCVCGGAQYATDARGSRLTKTAHGESLLGRCIGWLAGRQATIRYSRSGVDAGREPASASSD